VAVVPPVREVMSMELEAMLIVMLTLSENWQTLMSVIDFILKRK
jgi:hypothetical protein